MTGVFLSHSSPDKPFARRIGNDLRAFGTKVWIDEAEIRVGDSLIQKISEGIDNVDFLIVLLSQASCKSAWVEKEVNIALTQEIVGRRVKVLPCLLDDCNIPTFLTDKRYADFRDAANYLSQRDELALAMGLAIPPAQQEFLNKFVYHDLTDLNSGFDTASMKNFSAGDFLKALKRFETFNGKVFGIETWPDGKFGDVKVYEEYTDDAADSNWYLKAFEDFKHEGLTSHFTASGMIPGDVVDRFL
ncbi:TIR domain protein [Rosistilla ulvae]|uniref:TIR domain protein n=1 Tax=Rosistilla ulvae TaxID=1930277 RepID=A0A517M1F5_9BACT|nr:toll/interleukin-1 receptor domain-containing protein [Rosistilla ulvae]QDS88708.1 TIR domain protein [Rosistilla ulvae]